MDNASKAITFAVIVFISVAIISIFMMFLNIFRGFNANKNTLKNQEEINEFNKFFLECDYDIDRTTKETDLNGWDVYNIIKKIESINNDFDMQYVVSATTTSDGRSIEIDGDVTDSSYFMTYQKRENYYSDKDDINEILQTFDLAHLREKFIYTYEFSSDGYISEVKFVKK